MSNEFCHKIYGDMKILVIDDERSIRNLMQEILEDEGHSVDVAEDGAKGVEMAAADGEEGREDE